MIINSNSARGLERILQSLITVVLFGLTIWKANSAIAQTTANAELETIVVTAQRREVNLEDAPVAVSAFTGDAIKDKLALNLQDLATFTPNYQFSQQFGEAHLYIRGVGQAATNIGADQAVAVQLDDVYIARPEFGFANLLDVQRVEILRGPQGTLFGRNATGGVVNIIPNTPTKDFEGDARLLFGAKPLEYGAEAAVSGPLTANDELLGRFSFQRIYNNGYFDNYGPGGPSHLDNLDTWSGRGQLEWLPTPTLKVRLTAESYSEHDNGQAYFSEGTAAGGPTPNTVPPLHGVAGNAEGGYSEANQGEQYRQFTTVGLHIQDQVGTGTLVATYGTTFIRNLYLIDQDTTSLNTNYIRQLDTSRETFGQLLYQSDSASRFKYQFGVVGTHEVVDVNIILASPLLKSAPHPVLALAPYYCCSFGTVVSESYAGFGHLEYQVTDALTLFGGGRANFDHKGIDDYAVQGVGARKGDDGWNKFTYQAGARYSLAADSNVYASYATGYKGGGWVVGAAGPAFNPETNKSVELGYKSLFADKRVELNLAVFHMSYQDMQVSQVGLTSALVTNAARSTIYGFEPELTVLVTPHLRTELEGSFLHAKFDEFNSKDTSRPQLGILNLAGNQLPQVPEYKLSAGAYYTFDVPAGASLELGGRYYFQSIIYFSEFNVPINSSGGNASRADLSAVYYSGDRKYKVTAYAKNVTNQLVRSYGIINSALSGGIVETIYDPTRTVGINMERRF